MDGGPLARSVGHLSMRFHRRRDRRGRALQPIGRGRKLDRRDLSVGYPDRNVTGCFVIGVFNTLTEPDGVFLVPGNLRVFVMVGMCGGYTTFSSFSLETLNLVRNGEWFASGAYILASTVFCLIGVWLGHVAGILINR